MDRALRGDELSHHISSRFNDELEGVRSQLLEMGGLAESALTRSIAAIAEADSAVMALVADEERRINELERLIDEHCCRILATRSPTASDLRLVIMVLKAITDLERIGDEAEKVALAAARFQSRDRPANRYRELKHLGELVCAMTREALDAFARLDAERAFGVVRRDRVVDEEFEAIQRQSITYMMEDPRTIRRNLDVMLVVRAMERVGDHAKNICEYVIYVVHGKDVRHTRIEEAERELLSVKSSTSEAKQ